MKIYQLHERGGEYEDYYDYIRGSYLKKERAEEEKFKAEQREKERIAQSDKCANCPFLDYEDQNIDALLARNPDYCADAKITSGPFGFDCENYYLQFDESRFDIVEIEVEE